MTAISDAADALAKRMIDQGKLIEGGYEIFAHFVIAKDASQAQREEMRLAFMAGAEHLFSTIMGVLDPGDEPSADDMRRMDLIQQEIDAWRAKLQLRINPTQGRG